MQLGNHAEIYETSSSLETGFECSQKINGTYIPTVLDIKSANPIANHSMYVSSLH